MTPTQQRLYDEAQTAIDECQKAVDLTLATPWYRPLLLQKRERVMLEKRTEMRLARDRFIRAAAGFPR